MSEHTEQYQKQLSRMLQDPEGRAAISERLGMKLVQDNRDRARVLVMVPSYGNPKPDAQASWEVMIQQARTVANVHRPMIYGHSLVHWVRNEMAARAYQDCANGNIPGFDYILFIDDDIQVAPDALVRLLSHKKDIVSALCTKRADPPIPTLRIFDEKTGDFVQRLQWKQGGLIECDAAGTGMILISRHALDLIAEFYLDCAYETKLFGSTPEMMQLSAKRRERYANAPDERWRMNGLWFQTLPALNGCGEYGEDISFCLKARMCGLTIHCDTEVMPLHHGDYGYSIGDFFGYKRELIADMKAKGLYRDTEEEVPAPEEEKRVVLA